MKKLLVLALVALAPAAHAAEPALSNVQIAARNLGGLVKTDVGSLTNEIKVNGVSTGTLGPDFSGQINGAVNMIIAGPTFPGPILH